MKYLLAKNNHKPDFTYENGLYFNTVIDRDNYISTYLFDGEEWRKKITKTTQKDRIKQDGTGEIIINENTLSRKEIYDKNYIILRDCDDDDPEFYFITNVDHKSGNQYIITIQKDVITSNPGFMKDVGRMELIEGHINEASILDMVIDGGYRTPLNIKPLERDLNWEEIYPGTDINLLSNQWLYVFIREKQQSGDFPLFKLNGQIQPFRVLVAPLNPIIVQDNSETRTLISSVNESWSSVHYFHNEKKDVGDDQIRGDQNQLELERESRILKPINENIDKIKISFNFTQDGSTTSNIIEMPIDVLNDKYKDKWYPLFIGRDKSIFERLNNQLWKDGETDEGTYTHISAIELKYSPLIDKFEYRAIKRDRTPNSMLDKLRANQRAAWRRTWLGPVPTAWYPQYAWGRSKGDLNYAEVPYNTDVGAKRIKWPYMCGETGSFTVILSTTDYNKPINWNFSIKEIYQGEDTGLLNLTWDANSLKDYINLQANANDDASEVLISVRTSSFNPIELNSEGWMLNIKDKDVPTGPVTPDDWKPDGIYELFRQDTNNNKLFNTYDLSNYRDKSWIQGIENYSLIIENNKEFNLNPEYVYSEGKFTHEVIISPNEWVERIKWPDSLHTEELEFANNKEMIFATNAFNEYQANNPGALSNQQADNNADLLGGVLSTAIAGAGAYASGGTLVWIGTGVVGAQTLINNRKNKRNLKHNVAMMKQQPVISSGNGSAYADLYLNNNGFGLTLVEWQYTTNQAPSVIDSVIRSGLQFQNTVSTSYAKIKRPQFNYFKLTNSQEALTGVEMSIAEKQLLIDAFDAGIRLWYDPANFLKFTDESLDNPQLYNNSLFSRDMINYIDWNSEDTK